MRSAWRPVSVTPSTLNLRASGSKNIQAVITLIERWMEFSSYSESTVSAIKTSLKSMCGTSERAMRVLAFTEPATPYQAKFSMPYCIAAAVVDQQVTLETFTPSKFADRNIVEARKKVQLSFPDVPIWPGLADVGPDTEFVGNPVTIKMNDGRSLSARVDIPRGDAALPLTDDELLYKYRDCAHGQLRQDDIERSVGLVLALEKVPDVETLMAALSLPSHNA